MAIHERDNASIYFEVWSDESPSPAVDMPWVTLVNGHTRSLTDFKTFGRSLTQAGFRVLAFDNRGAGKTKTREPFSMDDLVEDVRSLWVHLNISKTHLLGISMGGMICQGLAVDYGQFIEKLVLVSTTPTHEAFRTDLPPWKADEPSIRARLIPYFSDNYARRNKLLIKSMVKQIHRDIQAGTFIERANFQSRAMEGFDSRSSLGIIDAPTLIAHGSEDRILAYSYAQLIAASIPHARIHEFSGAGHLLLAERPRELYALVEKFLGEPVATD